MAINPVNLTRVSFNLRTMSLVDSLRDGTLDLFKLQNQLATGKRLNTISDEPLSASRAVDLTELLEQQTKQLDTVRFASDYLSATDTAATEISDLLLEAKELALANAGSVTSQEERNAAATVINSIIDQLVAVGNREFVDMFLFGGRATQRPPFERLGDGVIYHGDGTELTANLRAVSDVAFSVTGSDFFGALTSEVRGYVDLNPTLGVATRIADVNGALGQGVRLGEIEIDEVGGVGAFRVDLRGADTIGDMIDLINAAYTAAGGAGALASLNGTADGIQLTSAAGLLSVRDADGGTASLDLGIRQTPAVAGTIVGADLDARLRLTTLLADLNGGAGVSLTAPIIVTNDGFNTTIDLSAATTVEDVINTINGANAGVRARINAAGNGIDVFSEVSGAELRIGEVGGTTAEQLGIRSLHADTPLSVLNNGKGVDIVPGRSDLSITAKDGSVYAVNLDGSLTLQDLIDAINAATGGAVVATVATNGNGIVLTDTTGSNLADLRVSRPTDSPSFAADDLGLNQSVPDPATTLQSDDVNGIEADGIFTVLIKLERALRAGSEAGLLEAGERLGSIIGELNERRGEVGARAATMAGRRVEIEDAVLLTRTTLSDIQDLDYTEAITKFTQAQTAFQANLTSGSQLLSLSLLDFLR